MADDTCPAYVTVPAQVMGTHPSVVGNDVKEIEPDSPDKEAEKPSLLKRIISPVSFR